MPELQSMANIGVVDMPGEPFERNHRRSLCRNGALLGMTIAIVPDVADESVIGLVIRSGEDADKPSITALGLPNPISEALSGLVRHEREPGISGQREGLDGSMISDVMVAHRSSPSR